jgi:hypothetical protein
MDDTRPQLRFTVFNESGGMTGNQAWRADISATGATYRESDYRWYLWRDAAPLPVSAINQLFDLARRHGAQVTVELIQPPAEPT